MQEETVRYQRVLLKLSGEALMGSDAYGINPEVLTYVVDEVKMIAARGVEVALVIGAGNIFRGVAGATTGMDRAAADHMGMLATVINSLALRDSLVRAGMDCRVMSAIAMSGICESHDRNRALVHLRQGRVVIFAGGTGNPYFTTDTAAVLRALEIGARVVYKATRVDGVYDRDPLQDDRAVRFERLSYREVLQRDLKVMDAAAISLAKDNDIPIVVLDMMVPGNILRSIGGEEVGTLVHSD